jgi:hypothetical protein
MDKHHRLQIANRIHLGLMRELGQGIDVKQMLDSTFYARDVLLVCQAHADNELARLATQFRQATDQAAARNTASSSTLPRDSTGFGMSMPAPIGAAFDSSLKPSSRQSTRRWLTPSRWFAD